ncbi:sensor histidine kinase [Paenibacillus koleovorans]|uniref:sensor histidine kinase n=1 Tax=Paenibacillus koleovorans TaxID=121608 RepID=UPI001FE3102A|nr:HAMP domain-containing sensor histidine kinase [Paenibacillus koleovorans]
MMARPRAKNNWNPLLQLQPESLRFQLLARSLLVLSALLLFIGLFQYVFMQHFMYDNAAAALRNEAIALTRDLQPIIGGPGQRRDAPVGRPSPFMQGNAYAVIDESGGLTVLAKAEDLLVPKLTESDYAAEMRRAPGTNSDFKVIRDSAGKEQLLVLQSFVERGRTRGLIQVSTSTQPIKNMLLQQCITFIVLSLIALVVGLLAFFPVLKRTLLPLGRMIRTTEQIDAGNLTERFPTGQGQEEIDRLADSFNAMLQRLEAAFEAEIEAKETMRRFIADASHELRTPLTSIHGFLEVLLRGAAHNPEQLERSLRSMFGESERINKLVNDLLLLARLDRTPTVRPEQGRLDELLTEMEPQLRLLAGTRKVRLDLSGYNAGVNDSAFDADKMKQVILNLFHNAIQHTDAARGEIAVTLKVAAGGAELAVKDNGTGIPVEHLPSLFDRFYRVDPSRARKYGGAGLGLSITKSIVDLHHGHIQVDSEVGVGTTFRVWLPAGKNKEFGS